ncbi:MAG: hypothetical protein DWH88_04325 [Planctomycetota bacterium]|nr:MAG: hypothetical protein DWH88_04325 [Planctomycetota bacterium]
MGFRIAFGWDIGASIGLGGYLYLTSVLNRVEVQAKQTRFVKWRNIRKQILEKPHEFGKWGGFVLNPCKVAQVG